MYSIINKIITGKNIKTNLSIPVLSMYSKSASVIKNMPPINEKFKNKII
tara:strand:+ start:368 stop:514 length:147 start_codon:yes stop_codon:yes gene_type:complete